MPLASALSSTRGTNEILKITYLPFKLHYYVSFGTRATVSGLQAIIINTNISLMLEDKLMAVKVQFKTFLDVKYGDPDQLHGSFFLLHTV